MLIRYAWRELRHSPRFCLLFILNLSLGLLGFIALDSLKRSFSDRLQDSARQMMAADLALSSRKPFGNEDLSAVASRLPPGTETQDMLTLYSMVASAQSSALVELKGVSEGYPFYGQIQLENAGVHRGSSALPLLRTAEVWVAPELLIQLDTKVGEALRIGKKDFIIADVIVDDSAASMVGTSMAPRVYIGQDKLLESDLVQFGSTAWRSKLFKLPPDADSKELQTLINKDLKDPGVRIKSYTEAGQDNGRMLGYLSDYLGLVSLVAMALAAIGASYLFRVHLDQRQKSIATLVSLGLTHERASLLYLMQVLALGLFSAILASLLSMGLMPLGAKLLQNLTPVAISPALSWPSYALSLLMGTVGAALVCLPLLARVRLLKPSTLFQEGAGGLAHEAHPGSWVAYLPALVGFYGLAVWQAHSWRVGSLFVGILAIVLCIFVVFALLLLKFLSRIKAGKTLSTRLAITYLHAHRSHTISAFVALGVGATLINLIPQIQHSIQSELQRPEGDGLPSLFLFDIQEDQVEGIQSLLTNEGIKPNSVSPMIMARLTKVNGQPYQRSGKDSEEGGGPETREEEEQQRFRNRGVNLSYRSDLAQAESITEGQFFQKPFAGDGNAIAELSIEERYAERMGFELGDQLSFDVQGLPIEGRVTSLRRVKWNTFQPNFFILMQPGAIDDAPKTFLLTMPEVKDQERALLQKKIVSQFPNVSIIDVSKLVAKITALVEQMALVLVVMGWLTVLTGNIVVFSIAHQQSIFRRWDHNLLKVLGADLKLIMRANLKEFGLLGLATAILGSVLGLLASFIISKVVFKGLWVPSLLLPTALASLLLLVCLLTAYAATRRTLGRKPSLQMDELQG